MEHVLHVICLCASWCGVCRDYSALFDDAALVFSTRAVFARIDIEDEAELLGDVDVENFPTLLITRGDHALFFGPITPHAQTLSRLVQGALAGELKPASDAPKVDALTQRMNAYFSGRSNPPPTRGARSELL